MRIVDFATEPQHRLPPPVRLPVPRIPHNQFCEADHSRVAFMRKVGGGKSSVEIAQHLRGTSLEAEPARFRALAERFGIKLREPAVTP